MILNYDIIRTSPNIQVVLQHIITYGQKGKQKIVIHKLMRVWDAQHMKLRPPFAAELCSGTVVSQRWVCERSYWIVSWTGLLMVAWWSLECSIIYTIITICVNITSKQAITTNLLIWLSAAAMMTMSLRSSSPSFEQCFSSLSCPWLVE